MRKRGIVGVAVVLGLFVIPAALTSADSSARPQARAGTTDLIDPKLPLYRTVTGGTDVNWTGTVHIIYTKKEFLDNAVETINLAATDDLLVTIDASSTIARASYSETYSHVPKQLDLFKCRNDAKAKYQGSYDGPGRIAGGQVTAWFDRDRGSYVISVRPPNYQVTGASTYIAGGKSGCTTETTSSTAPHYAAPVEGFALPPGTSPEGSTELVGNYTTPPLVAGDRTEVWQYSWNLHMCGLESGHAWVSAYPDSKKVADLSEPFRGNVQRFLAALKNARGLVPIAHHQQYKTAIPYPVHPFISTTYRPDPRAYLMHYSFRVAGGKPGSVQFSKLDPAKVPAYKNSGRDPRFKKNGLAAVPICWVHRDVDGNVTPETEKESVAAAAEMRDEFGIDKSAPGAAFPSNHSAGEAIDMNISWKYTLLVKDASGAVRMVKTGRDLFAVAATYGVTKHIGNCGPVPKPPDAPHWSLTGC